MYNSMYSAAGHEETKDGGFFNGVVDFARYGVTSSLLSGVQSIANTGISLANTLGANYESFDTRETLTGLGLDETSSYYAEHQTALDTVGFVATAFIPGFVGVKAARAAISAGGSSGIKFVAGLADIADNSRRAGVINGIARAGNVGDAFAARNALIAKGFAQNAVESFAAETAIALTMNQSPVMDPQSTNYFENLATNFTSGTFWTGVGFGTALGGVIEGAGIMYGVKKAAKSFVTGVNKTAGIATTGEVAGLAGDEIVRSQKQMEGFTANIQNLDTPEAQALGQKNFKQQQQIRASAVDKATRRDPVSTTLLTGYLDDTAIPYESKVQLFSGVKSATTPYKNEELFTVPSVQQVVEGDRATALKKIADIYAEVPNFKGVPRDQLDKYVSDQLSPVMDKAYGFADRTPGLRYSYINPDSASSAHNIAPVKFDDKTLDFIYDKGGDEAVMATIMHEKGHLTADWLSSASMAGTKFGKKVTSELEALSRVARPGDWEALDSFEKMIAAGSMPDNLRPRAEQHISYMRNHRELWADAFSVMENPDLADVTRKMAPSAARLALRERSLSQRFSDTKRVLNINTKEISREGFAFNAADHGVKAQGFKNNKTSYLVDLDGGKYTVNVMDKYNPELVAPRDAAAHMWAWMRPDSELKLAINKPMEFSEIPMMTRALKDMQASEAAGKPLTVKVMNAEGKAVDVSSSDAMATHLIDAKKDMVSKLSGKMIVDADTGLPRVLTHYEIGRIADVSPDFALGQYNANAFDSLINDVTKPQHIVLRYDRRAVTDYKGRSAEAAAFDRIEMSKAHADSLHASVFGEASKAFPERVRQSALSPTSPMLDISSFEGGLNMLGQANGEYFTGAGFAQAIGSQLNTHQARLRKTLGETFESLRVGITSDEKSLSEFNVFDSWHRGHRAVYKLEGDDNPIGVYQRLVEAVKSATDPAVAANLQKALQESQTRIQAIQGAGLEEWFANARSRYMSDKSLGEMRTLLDNPLSSAEDWRAWYDRNVSATIKGSHVIDVESPAVDNFITQYRDLNDKYSNQRMMINRAKGKNGRAANGRIYLGPADTARTPFHAYVVAGDESVGATKEVGVVMAMDAKGLQTKIAQVQSKFGSSVKIVTESDRELYLKAKKDWDATKRHGDLLVDSDLQRAGILSDVLPERDPTAVTRSIDALTNMATGNMREATAVKYAEEIAELRAYGAESAMAAKARFAASKSNSRAGDSWAEQERMMLNLSASHSDSKWLEFQNHVDGAATRVMNGIQDAFRSATAQKFTDAAIANMDEAMKKYGYKGPFDPSNPGMRDLFATAGKQHTGALTKVSSMLNGLVATTMLRLDAANWMVNAMSMPITAAPELRVLRNMIGEAGKAEMDALGNVVIPGTKRTMPSNAKVIAQATKEFFTDKKLVDKYVEWGIVPKDIRSMLETGDYVSGALGDLFQANSSTIGQAINKTMQTITKATDFIGKGGDFAERFNYAVAARSAEIMIDTSGMAISEGTKRAMMTRFATRINGNYAAAQRPALFQGFAGQAIGLFQTYGMNMMNNMLRYVGTDKKAALTMLGMQGAVFGANSLPGFETLNRLVWERTENRDDLHTSTADILGQDMSEWLLYGLGSNFTKPLIGEGIGVYSRGNVTPQNPLIIPTSFDEIPAIRSTAKTIGAMMDMFSNVAGGQDVGSAFGSALAAQGLNRPLQGIGQMATGEVSSAKGNRIYEVDFTNWWSTATRLMGAKPLKDAMKQDAYYRMRKYKADAEDAAIDAFKPLDASIRMGNGAPDDLLDSAMQAYVSQGHSYDAFSRKLQHSMLLSSQGELMQMRNKVTSPEGQYIARVLADNE